MDEIVFNDALTLNLRRGRFLLLIVGDGIREGVEAIAEYLQAHAGLHFSLGLVEMPIYDAPDGTRVIAPRVLARTNVIVRHVVAVPEGFTISEEDAVPTEAIVEANPHGDEQRLFWKEFLDGLQLDDPEQAIPRPARAGYVTFMLPAPAGSCWLTVYRDVRRGEVGVSLSSTRNSPGEIAMLAAAEDWAMLKEELGGSAAIVETKGRPRITEYRAVGDLTNAQVRVAAFDWLRQRTNVFVNVLRPRIRSVIADLSRAGE
ncbi:hypothetical protein ACLN6N_13375 [Sphingomonas carotinifaciens]|uniref:hypothetical protein n=1 Tax=Sphingomonas carotinifaciens TaxID=1166323 RepID=UPI00399F948B